MNKQNKRRTWVDLSDMLVWSGHFTGIQRVVYEYAKRFDADGANFFAYDKIDHRFIELQLDQFKLSSPAVTDEAPPDKANVTLRRKIRYKLGRPYYMMPEERKAILRPLANAINFYLRFGISKLSPSLPQQTSSYAEYPQATFERSDTVILLGAGWNDSVAFEKLIEVKEQVCFRLIQHINDILPIYQPQLFSEELPGKFRAYINKAIHHADVITVISKATKRDVEVYCNENGVTDTRVEIIRLGEDVITEKPLRPEAVPVGEDFILAVGTFEVRKNYILLYQAAKLAQLKEQPLPRIVIAGRKGWLTNDLAHILSLDPYAHQNITWLQDISDNELSWLYENCMFTVFPSLAEGWGLPIVESLQHGKMAIASGVSSMLEIGEGLVDHFLPYDASECLDKIRYYIAEDRYINLNKKVQKSYKAFSWDESYKDLISTIS